MAVETTNYAIGLLDQTQGAFRSITRNIKGLQGAFAGLAAAAGVGQFAGFIRSTSEAVDEIGKLSTRLGVSTEALSEYQFVANQTGVSFNTLSTAFQRLGRRVSQAAAGTGEAKDALAELGLDARQLNLLPIERQFETIADALNEVKNANDQVRLAQKLFDSEGVAALQTIKSTTDGIRALREEARNAGVSIDRDLAGKAADLNDSFGRLAQQTRGLGNDLVRALAPALTSIVDGFTGAADASRDFLNTVGILNRSLNSLEAPQLVNEFIEAQTAANKYGAELEVLTARLERLQERQKTSPRAGNLLFGLFNQSRDLQENIRRFQAEYDQFSQRASDALLQIADSVFAVDDGLSAVTTRANEFGAALEATQGAIDDSLANELDAQREAARAAEAAQRAYATIINSSGTLQERYALQLRETLELLKIFPGTAQQAQNAVAQLGVAYLDALEQNNDPVGDALKQAQEAQAEAVRQAQKEQRVYDQIIRQSGTAEERYAQAIRDRLTLLEDFPGTAEQAQRALLEVFEQYKIELEGGTEEFETATDDLLDSIRRNTDQLADDLVGIFRDGAGSIKDVFSDLANTIAEDIFRKQIAEPISDAFGDLLDVLTPGGGIGGGLGRLGGVFDGIGSFFGGLFGNSQGGLYKVAGVGGGERPVAFTAQPGEYVEVTPKGAGRGGSVNVNFTVNSLDPRTAASVIIENRAAIVSVVQGAFERTGRAPQVA